MSLNHLPMGFDLNTDTSKGQLYETLELMAARIARMGTELEQVKEADDIVRPVPIEAFPVAAGQIYTGREGGEVGGVEWRAVKETPVGTLLCDGSVVSQTTYSDLYAKVGTTYNVGGEGAGNFRLPDLRRKVLVGEGGSGSAELGSAVGSYGGEEVVTLVEADLPAHSHSIAHTHDISHDHNVAYQYGGAGGAHGTPDILGTNASQVTATTKGMDSQVGTTSGASSTNSSGDTGGDAGHNNMQPSLVMAPYIRYRLGPTDTIQTLPIVWTGPAGSCGGQWRLDTLKNFPVTVPSNEHVTITSSERPEMVVKVSAVSGTESGISTANEIVFGTPIPYNFRKFKTNAIRVRTRVEMTGVSDDVTLTLKVSDPITAGAYLAATATRTIAESGGTVSDGGYVDMELTAADLGPNWRPEYALRCELEFGIPNTFTTCDLYVGKLNIRWK